jgi:hypothetical protein
MNPHLPSPPGFPPRRVLRWGLTLAGYLMLLPAIWAQVPATRLFWFPSLQTWPSQPGSSPGTLRIESPELRPDFAWTEAVVSWNAPTNVALTLSAARNGQPPWYVLGHWSAQTNAAPRTSVGGQHDADARVDTDTLVVKQPADHLRVRLEVRSVDGSPVDPTRLRLGVSLLGTNLIAPGALHREAWGRRLAVPIFSQADYPEGIHTWCSPTSLTMLLGWWRERGMAAGPAWDVPDTARGVHDPGWPGTGNWPFNTAFAGQQPGLSACVARFSGLGDLEAWLAAGRPVATSVSYAQMKGNREPKPGDGHLVVVTGFTSTGDVEVNDPGVGKDRVARVVPREQFERAWAHSSRTVYLVWPTAQGLLPGGEGRW